MNSLNLKQIDGGNIIKQADSGSLFKFELLDENHKKFEEQLGDTATVILKKDTVAVFKKIVAVTDNCVAFNLDKILEVGDYILEIIVGEYVFPSNNRLKISVESTYGDYQPENLVRITYEEIDEKINKLKDRLNDLNVAGQTEMLMRIENLEAKEDKDTIYDDTPIIKRIEKLESKEDNDTIYDDSEIKRRITALEQKEDHDTIYDDTEIKQSVADVDTKVDNLSEKVTALEERPIVDTALTERVEALERKEDKDTVYDDTPIIKRIETLEDKPDNDTIYDDSNLKAQIAELESKLQSLNTVRRAPTGYTLDRTTTPWTIWFDNGCGMTIPEYGTTASIYGYGQGQNAYNNNLAAYPLPPIIMSVSHGTLTVEKIKTIEGMCDFWASGITIINPIRDRNDYDWTNARFNKASLDYAGDPYYSYKYVRQQYFIRTMYELGIWSGEIVEEFGATKK